MGGRTRFAIPILGKGDLKLCHLCCAPPVHGWQTNNEGAAASGKREVAVWSTQTGVRGTYAEVMKLAAPDGAAGVYQVYQCQAQDCTFSVRADNRRHCASNSYL